MSEWISVKDRLPEYGEHVLMCEEGKDTNYTIVGILYSMDEWGDRYGEPLPFTVTHWMPIPDSPEPAKSDLRRVCEWLGIDPTCGNVTDADRIWADLDAGRSGVDRNALLWRIEEALGKRCDAVLGWEYDMQGTSWVATYRIHYGLSTTVEASARGEALLKAALWLKNQGGR